MVNSARLSLKKSLALSNHMFFVQWLVYDTSAKKDSNKCFEAAIAVALGNTAVFYIVF